MNSAEIEKKVKNMTIKTISIRKEEIKNVIQKTIKESIKEEFLKLRLELIPEISTKEMYEIEKKYKKPDKNIVRSEYIAL